LQAEEMINYYFNKKTNFNIDEIDKIIKDEVSGYKPFKKPIQVHHIFYTHKLLAFKSISNLQRKILDILLFVNEFRNELSHRNSLTLDSEDRDLTLYEKSGFLKTKPDFKNLDQKQKEIFNRGEYIIKKRKENFDLIYITLEEFKDKILESLNDLTPISKTSLGANNLNLLQINKQAFQGKEPS
jgi:hypothetical protein